MGYSDKQVSGGSGGVHVAIVQKSDASKGIEVALAEDATWKMEGVQRATGNRAQVEIEGATAGAKITIYSPQDFTGNDDQQYELANGWDIILAQGTTPVAMVPAVAAVDGASATVRLYYGASDSDDYVLVGRVDADAQGNGWDVTFTTVDLAVGTTGVQITVSGTQLQILISTTITPSVRTVRNAINNEAAFTAAYVAGNEPAATVAMPTDIAAVLPNGNTIGTIRYEDFAGGIDAVAAVDAIPAVAGATVEFRGERSSGVTADDDWFIALNSLTTLDEIIAVIQGADYLDLVDREGGGAPVHVFPDADVVLSGDGGSLVAATLLGGEGTENETLTLSGAVDAVPPGYSVDKDAKTLTISYDTVDTALEVLELLDKPAKSVLINGTADDAVLESPPWTKTFRGIGGR